MYAAGVLPLSWVDTGQGPRAMFLVGKDARDDSWSDFAGKFEKCDRDIASTAAREFWEETYGVLMDARVMRARLVAGACIPLKGRTQNCHPYYCYVAEVPFLLHLRSAFAKHLAFLRYRNTQRVYVEKTDIVYVTLEELFSEEFPKRGVFRETLLHNRDRLERVAAAGPRGWAGECAAAAPDIF